MSNQATADALRKQAFRLLLAHARPLSVEEMADAIGTVPADAAIAMAELAAAGRVRVDGARLTGSAGLSVAPDRHEIELSGRRFWTWCAYDVFGIFGATGASGTAVSSSPADGTTIGLRFLEGRPEPAEAVLFRPDADLMGSCDNVYEQWCPNSNLFRHAEMAEAWAAERGIGGQVLTLGEASEQATREWAPLLD
jgi:hypothetical protein